jgi:hypothetical protein
MTAKQLAAQLNGREYPFNLTEEEVKICKGSNLVVVFGASDDLCEIRGVIEDEVGCFDGGDILLDKKGVLASWDEVKEDEDLAAKYLKRKAGKFHTITAGWCKESGYSWTYATKVPHDTFEIMEDGEHYCRGMVIALEDLG